MRWLMAWLVTVSLSVSLASAGEQTQAKNDLFRAGEFRIFAVIIPDLPQGPKVSIQFEYPGRTLQVLATPNLRSMEEARQYYDTARVDFCQNAPGRWMFRVGMSTVNGLYTVVEPQNRRWGQFPSSVTSCSDAAAQPPAWNPAIKKRPQ